MRCAGVAGEVVVVVGLHFESWCECEGVVMRSNAVASCNLFCARQTFESKQRKVEQKHSEYEAMAQI